MFIEPPKGLHSGNLITTVPTGESNEFGDILRNDFWVAYTSGPHLVVPSATSVVFRIYSPLNNLNFSTDVVGLSVGRTLPSTDTNFTIPAFPTLVGLSSQHQQYLYELTITKTAYDSESHRFLVTDPNTSVTLKVYCDAYWTYWNGPLSY